MQCNSRTNQNYWISLLYHLLSSLFTTHSRVSMTLKKRPLKKLEKEKGEYAGNQHYNYVYLFHIMFSEDTSHYLSHIYIVVYKAFQFNFLPKGKNIGLSKLQAFVDDKIHVTQKLKFVFGRVENIVGKGKMLVTSIFSFSLNVFKNFLFHWC